ncbi:MAG: Maf family protein [Eubacteriales bacterium]
MRKIILASSSPRRSGLLRQIGISFEVRALPVDEFFNPGAEPHELVEQLAWRKAAAVAALCREGLVLGADTVVALRGRVLGKPGSRDDAVRMLEMLSGNTHDVYTGVALLDIESGRSLLRHEKTRVTFKHLEEGEIRRYAATGESFGKAGSYAVQGRAAVFIRSIEGCYSNVVGLPLSLLADMFKELGWPVI